MPIQKFMIENFKSIKSLSLGCKRINLFLGEPNTGKSNILEAIGVLSHMATGLQINRFVRFETMTDLFYDRILDDPIVIGFDNNVLRIEFKDGQYHGTVEGLRMERNQQVKWRATVFSYGHGGGGVQWRHENFDMFKFYRYSKRIDFGNPRSDFLHPPDGDNLVAVVMTSRGLRDTVKNIFGKFGYRIVFKPQEGRMEVQKELEDVLFSFPYSMASETLQRLVFYLAAIHSNKDSVMAFEEPEAHAFPYYTKYLAERIALDQGNNQYFIATHNPYFLTAILEKAPKQEVEIFVTSLENYQTRVRALTEENKKEILSDMGYDIFFNIKEFLG